MITLITGGPGAGKTALALHLVLSEYPNRPVFSNVRGLTIEHSSIPSIEEWTVFEANGQGTGEFRFTFPENAVIIIDEAQQFFRPRATGSKVPPYVQAFETHRQDGIDFVLMTQHSSFLDANIRKLIKNARHIFIKPGFFGRYRFERPDAFNEDDRTELALCKKSRYKLPAYVFPLYKSSKLHTKPARPGLPSQAYVLGAALLVIAGAGWALYGSMSERFADKPPESIQVRSPGAERGTAQPARAPRQVGGVVPVSMMEAVIPSDANNHLSAPLYAAVVPSVVPPMVVACVSSASSCTCYSQQITPLYMPDDQCRARAAGQYYDPYRAPPVESKTKPKPVEVQSSPGGLAGGFEDGPPA
jgi:zona occludens toxin